MEPKLFSVAIVTYNQKKFIMECIDSVLEQDYPNIELVICDDHSYDFDAEQLHKYIEKNKKDNIKSVIFYQQKNNLGTVKNCNQACHLASGELFKLLAADDKLYSDKVLSMAAEQFENPKMNVLCARGRGCENDGTVTLDLYPPNTEFEKLSHYDTDHILYMLCTLPWSSILAPAVFFRLSFLKEFGCFDESYTYTEDWPMWIHLCKAGCHLHFLNEMVVYYRYGGISNKGDLKKVSTIRRLHYQECIRLLETEALPIVKEKFSKLAVLRCTYSIHCYKMKDVHDFEWPFMSFFDKLKFRVVNFPFTLYVKLMGAIGNNKHFNLKKDAILFAGITSMLLFHIPFFPGFHGTWVLSASLLLVSLIMTFKVGSNIILSFLHYRTMRMTRQSKGN